MPELMVVRFAGIHRATEALHDLRDLQAQRTVDLADAVAVYRTTEGRLLVDESVKPTAQEGATLGGLLGALVGLLLATPIAGGVSAAAAATAISAGTLTLGTTGAVIGHHEAADVKSTSGISENLISDLGGMVQPGQSALFVLADTLDPDRVARRLGRYGGTILRTTLPAEEVQRLQHVVETGGDGILARGA